MSDSVWPHRRQLTRLPRPWDSPGKNTGVGCHFLLQCTKVKSESEVTQSCPTLSDPMDCSPPGSSVHGFSRQRSTGVGCHCLLRKSALLRVFFMFSIPDLLDFKSNSHLSQNLECYLFILGCCLRESPQLPTCSDQRTMLGDGFYH